MPALRALGLSFLTLATITSSRADDAIQSGDAPAVRPAILLVPMFQSAPARPPSRHVEVIPPQVITPPDARTVDDQSTEPAPPPGYRLVGTYAPNPLWSSLRYYVFADLRDPFIARNWRAWQRAIRAEQREAQAEAYNLHLWAVRKQQLLSAHERAVVEGLEYLRSGRYRHALIALTRAAELNQADPGCRIHLAQARMAVGHDAEAARVLRRALELQPGLIPRQLDLHSCYPVPEEYEAHIDALAARLSRKIVVTADEYLLLGFFEFQRDRLDAAHAAFQRAAQLRHKDDTITAYLHLTRPVVQP